MATKLPPDFEIEMHPRDRAIRLVTPLSPSAVYWSIKNMPEELRWGRSYCYTVAKAGKLVIELQRQHAFKVRH